MRARVAILILAATGALGACTACPSAPALPTPSTTSTTLVIRSIPVNTAPCPAGMMCAL